MDENTVLRKDEERVSTKCPYCGHSQFVVGSIFGLNIASCDNETGGCDCYFAVKIKKEISAETFEIDKQKRQ